MVQKKQVLVFLFLVGFLALNAQDERSYIRKGNKFFNDSNFTMADFMYLKASEINPESIEAKYNLANSKYTQKNYVEAITDYENLIPQLKAKNQKAKAFHNLGNSYLKSQKLEEAIEAYKNALRNNPNDENSRYNLAYAKKMMVKNKDQKNKDKNKKDQNKEKDQKNKDDKKGEKEKNKDGNKKEKSDDKVDDKKKQSKDSEEENNEKKESEGGEGKEKEDKQNQGKEEQQQTTKKVKAISKAEAIELLKQLENKEKTVREKMIKAQMKNKPRKKIEKDW